MDLWCVFKYWNCKVLCNEWLCYSTFDPWSVPLFFSSCALYVKSRGVDQLLSSSSTFCTGSLCGRNAVRTGTDCVAHLLLRNPDLGFVLVCCASPLANRIWSDWTSCRIIHRRVIYGFLIFLIWTSNLG